ncbi:hypothetical protein ACF1DY_10725 [Streptomyces albus]
MASQSTQPSGSSQRALLAVSGRTSDGVEPIITDSLRSPTDAGVE